MLGFHLLPLLALGAASSASAALLQPTFSTCENYYNAAPGVNRLNVTNVYAEYVHGARARQLSLPGEGSDVLRVDLIGTVGSEVIGYDNGTNKLGESSWSIRWDASFRRRSLSIEARWSACTPY